jgi:K(+)-stimulated pyrophosphate-energized sodium pump
MSILSFDVLFFQIVSIVIAVLAFGAAFWLYKWVEKQPSSNAKIAEVSKLIRNGAYTFLAKEYRTLVKFCSVAAILILVFLPQPIWKGNVLENVTMALAYICGTVFSGIAGKIGISIATIANVKAAESATKGIKPSFMSGFRGGAVMGMAVVGSSLLGVSLVLLITNNTTALLGFSFGASSMALFAKAGGGIFTKTADISADLVGKVELGILRMIRETLRLSLIM